MVHGVLVAAQRGAQLEQLRGRLAQPRLLEIGVVGNAKITRRSGRWISRACPGTPLQYEKYQHESVGTSS
jgi:hypothetical protein